MTSLFPLQNRQLEEPLAEACPIELLESGDFAEWRRRAGEDEVDAARQAGFTGRAHSWLILGAGRERRVIAGCDPMQPRWVLGSAPRTLPAGVYRLADQTPAVLGERAAVSWLLGSYAFDRYRSSPSPEPARLCWPAGVDRRRVTAEAEAMVLVRDLVNTPANDMGPEELQATATELAERHGARLSVLVGDELLAQGYPLVHAVGRASARPPRLLELAWGEAAAPKVTLVGKGVCFDTGGLNLKTADTMLLMKKDMGGAAHALGLAHMVMSLGVGVRLRVIIPAVENAVGGRAMRPLDVIRSRKGLTVEIGHTDAEGRLILADALAAACDDQPGLLMDFATLTGAARVALGAEMVALFCTDDALAESLLRSAVAQEDPMWRLPFWAPYGEAMRGRAGDLLSVMPTNQAGAIHAAEFLKRFVSPGTPWAHLDLFAWNPAARPGRPEGGEAQALLPAFAAISDFARSGAVI